MHITYRRYWLVNMPTTQYGTLQPVSGAPWTHSLTRCQDLELRGEIKYTEAPLGPPGSLSRGALAIRQLAVAVDHPSGHRSLQ
jgi:hypothetical protein